MEALAQEMVGQRVLVTTDNWFYAPDGRQYKAAVGRLRSIRSAVETLGIKVNSRSVDWYAEVGRLLIAGCQIHYAIAVIDSEPNLSTASDWTHGKDGDLKLYERPSAIFDAGD